MYKVRIHCRGGQGGRTAAKIIAVAAYKEGKEVQAFSIYGAERRGAPVQSFVRIADGPIYERGYITDPDCVLVLDASLLKTVNVTDGLDRNGTLMIVNATKPLKIKTKAKVVYVDVNSIAMKFLGVPIYNTTILGAFVKLTNIVKLKTMEAAIKVVLEKMPHAVEEKNVQAMKACYDVVKV
ncbi:MAG: 2-oxoacid:acceptor oxidoreductase family protein [Candidatus Diapherotrites archaeon]|nr:2-oxoacid:acceptor oxidoreductase family protein [Candidatus Diapherotrites archaeon]